MSGELIAQLRSWEPIERVSVVVVRRWVASIIHATRFVGPGDQIGTVVTLVQRPAERGIGRKRELTVISGAALVASCAGRHDDAVVDARLRWWASDGRRVLDLPAMGVRLSVRSGSVRSWPSVGAPEHRRVIRVRRVAVEEVIDVASRNAGHAVDDATSTWRALNGNHLGLLTDWPVRAGAQRREPGRRRSVPRLAVSPPDAVCRSPWSARAKSPETEQISR